MSFVFIDSEFVTAIKMGYWVLLDNVNSAPPEVIERINSLLEEEPTLNIYEYHDGEELIREKNTIHQDFRIFCTSNSQRELANKLSSAFINRVIRIWLPKILVYVTMVL
jgi:midasin